MFVTISRTVEITEDELKLLKHLCDNAYCFNYAEDDYPLDTFDSIVRKGLANEDSDGRVSINRAGVQVVNQIP